MEPYRSPNPDQNSHLENSPGQLGLSSELAFFMGLYQGLRHPANKNVPANPLAPLEETHAELVTQADKLLGAQAQVDPKFQTETLYTRMTGESLRAALAESLDIPIGRLPAPRSLQRLMNRRGFLLKKVRKTIPLKKIPQTDAIYENVRAARLRAESDQTLMIDLDNGPDCQSHRTQFVHRITQFADSSGQVVTKVSALALRNQTRQNLDHQRAAVELA